MSNPQSDIRICSGVRLTSDYIHTIWFDSLEAQQEYFAGKVVKSFSAYTYIRKSWKLKVDATMEEARTWSYLYFRNAQGKRYYYFINNIEYINDNTVELDIEIDVLQTYMFDYRLSSCFVEREHAATDQIGDNIIDEGLELGDYAVIAESDVNLAELVVLVLATYDPNLTNADVTTVLYGANYNKVFSGLGVYAVEYTKEIAWCNKMQELSSAGKLDGIVSMWVYPKALIGLDPVDNWGNDKVTKRVSGVQSFYSEYKRNNALSGGYTPRNKKLYTYPYNFLYVHNNSGGAGVFPYEYFGDPSACNFRVVGSLSPEGVAGIYPLNFKGSQHAYEEGLTLGGFPTCAWNEDIYKMWLAQNQNQLDLSNTMAGIKIASGIGTAIGGLATGNIPMALAGGGVALSGASSIAETLAMKKDKEIQPPQARGRHSGSVNVMAGFQTFTVQKKSITTKYARIIDEYFDLYGYKTNRVKVPNRNVRENYTYTKTLNCHVYGNLCNEDLKKIESIFDRGVTFWVNGDKIGDYTVSNNCKSEV